VLPTQRGVHIFQVAHTIYYKAMQSKRRWVVGLVIASSVYAIWVLAGGPYGMSLFCVTGNRPCNHHLGSCHLGPFWGPLWYVPILRFGQSAL
jgi:hypothetical protein